MKNGATSIITGGGRGIGRAIALRLAEDTNIIVVGRTEKDLVSVCEEIKKSGGDADYFMGDIANPETAAKTIALLKDKDWKVKNLICNAGVAKGGKTETFDKELWREMFDVNVHGNFYFVQAVLPEMLKNKKGTICLISSIAGVKGYKNIAAYTATKHALVGFARSLALEYGKHGIVAVPICPSFVETEMTLRTIRGLMERHGISESDARARVADATPQKRIMSPEEVAEAVAFVCFGKVPSLSGNPLILSGGE